MPRRKKGLGLFSGVKEEQQNAPDWWDSEEGRAFKAEYNTESGKMARIHVKVWDEQVRRPGSTLLSSNMLDILAQQQSIARLTRTVCCAGLPGAQDVDARQ